MTEEVVRRGSALPDDVEPGARATGFPDRLSEADLGIALAAGDSVAFAVLVERETPNVYRTCYWVLGDADEAQEATQEAFVLAYRGLGTFRAEGSAGAWIARIAIRESWRRSKARDRRRASVTPLDDPYTAGLQDHSDMQADVIAEEDRQAVRLAVGELPEPYREVISLRYFSGLSLADIAAATGRPLGTIKAQVHRGLGRLRAILDAQQR